MDDEVADDIFFCDLDLDEIIALEQASQAAKDEAKENRAISSPSVVHKEVPPPSKINRPISPEPVKLCEPNKRKSIQANLDNYGLENGDFGFLSGTRSWSTPVSNNVNKFNVAPSPNSMEERKVIQRNVPFKMEPVKSVNSAVPSSSKKFRFKSQSGQSKIVAASALPAVKSTSSSITALPRINSKSSHVPARFVVDLEEEDEEALLLSGKDQVVASESGPPKVVAGNQCDSKNAMRSTSSMTGPDRALSTSKMYTFQKSKNPVKAPTTLVSTSKFEVKPNLDISKINSCESSSTSFEDDDDFLPPEVLDKIAELERLSEEECDSKSKENVQESTIHPTSSFPFLKPATPPPVTTKQSKKKFQFQKRGSSFITQQSPIKDPVQTSNSSDIKAVNESRLVDQGLAADDDDFISEDELEKINEFERSLVQGACKTTSEKTNFTHVTRFPNNAPKLGGTAVTDNVKKPSLLPSKPKPLPYLFPPPSGSVAADEEWKKFQGSFANNEQFKVPWFQAIPVTGLNISCCKTIASFSNNLLYLAQFSSKYLLPFLKELKASTDATMDSNDLPIKDEGYYNDIMKQLENVLIRFREEQNSQSSGFALLSQKVEFQELIQGIFDSFRQRTLDFSDTSIPEMIVHLHPSALEILVASAIKTQDVLLLVPVCSSQSTLQHVLSTLLCRPTNLASASTLDEDPDFIVNTNYALKCKFVARKLLHSLREKLGNEFLKIVPISFQSLFSLEFTLSLKTCGVRIISNDLIAQNIFTVLNTVFHDGNEDFAEFMVSTLPLTQKLLSDKHLTRKLVRASKYPNLWHYLRKTKHS